MDEQVEAELLANRTEIHKTVQAFVEQHADFNRVKRSIEKVLPQEPAAMLIGAMTHLCVAMVIEGAMIRKGE